MRTVLLNTKSFCHDVKSNILIRSKKYVDVSKQPLPYLANLSFRQSLIPKSLKIVRVKPVSPSVTACANGYIATSTESTEIKTKFYEVYDSMHNCTLAPFSRKSKYCSYRAPLNIRLHLRWQPK